jgi:hypothetical protein
MRWLTLAVLGLTLSSCSSDTTYKSGFDNDPDPVSRDDVFLEVVREDTPELSAVPDAEVIGIAKQVCRDIDTIPLDTPELFGIYMMSAAEEVDDPQSMGFFFGAAIETYCPEDRFLIRGLS